MKGGTLVMDEVGPEEKEAAAAAMCPCICQFRGKPIKRITTAWRTTLDHAGIERNIRPYDIRHFHITHALGRGAPMQDLAERLGHVNTTMLVRVYTHMVDELRTKRPFDLPQIRKL